MMTKSTGSTFTKFVQGFGFPKSLEPFWARGEGGFALIANVESVESEVTIDDDIVVRRATVDEETLLRDLLHEPRSPANVLPQPNPYEHRPVKRPHPTGWEPLDKAEFKYCVVSWSSKGSTAPNHLFDMSTLSSAELERGPQVTFSTTGAGYNPDRHAVESLSRNAFPFQRLGSEQLVELSRLYRQWDKATSNRALKAAMSQYKQLKRLDHGTLRFVGYVAIIESLITHEPNPGDPYSSLTRQICQKMTLLSRRFSLKLDYSQFEGVDTEKVWKAIYHYRSKIAHGGTPSFSTKELKPLRDPEVAMSFVQYATKAVMRHLLDEPELLADLKNC